MSRKLTVFLMGLLTVVLALVGLTVALMAIASIYLTITSQSGLPNDSLYQWSIWIASRAIILAALLGLLAIAALIGIWLPFKLWANLEGKPLPEKMIHRINPDA